MFTICWWGFPSDVPLSYVNSHARRSYTQHFYVLRTSLLVCWRPNLRQIKYHKWIITARKCYKDQFTSAASFKSDSCNLFGYKQHRNVRFPLKCADLRERAASRSWLFQNQSLDWKNHDWFRFCHLIPFSTQNQSMDWPSVLESTINLHKNSVMIVLK